MLNTFRSFLINKIINRIRYLRYTTNYISINENNLNKIKHISRTLNKKELIARTEKNKINTFSNYFSIKFKEFTTLGYTIFSVEELKKISEYNQAFKFFESNFSNLELSKLRYNNIFHILELNLQDNNLRKFINIFIPFVSNYLNILPVVTTASLWHSLPNKNQNYIGSQLPHFDPEDSKQVKIFLALGDINKSNGVLNVYKKNESIDIKKILNNNKIEVNKKIPESYFKNYNPTELNLNKGDVAIVDTFACYHFGGRVKENFRKQITILLNDPFCSIYPLFRSFDKKRDLIWDFAHLSYDRVKKSKEFKIF